jgi:Domain of unknown function (DUF5076)
MGFSDGQLSIPGEAIADPNSAEMVRAWIANKGLHCTVNIGIWGQGGRHDERDAWGILLADITRHVADALALEGEDRIESIARIRKSFLIELDNPTSGTTGDFVDGPSRN